MTTTALSLPPWIKPLDTTAWADAQDRVIYEGASSSTLVEFQPLCNLQKRTSGETNLTVRQEALLGGCDHAFSMFEKLVDTRWKDHPIYVEGFSYLRYCVSAFGAAGLSQPSSSALISRLYNTYETLRAPDGSIPLPECREEHKPLLTASEWTGVRWVGPYLVVRTARLYFLLNMDDSFLHYKKNLHVKPAAGSYVLWMDGRWIEPPRWYTGFNYKDVLREGTMYGQPKGAIPVDWRVKGLEVEFDVTATASNVRMDAFAADLKYRRPGGQPSSVEMFVDETTAPVSMDSFSATITYRQPSRFFGILPGRKTRRRVELSLGKLSRLVITDDDKPVYVTLGLK